MCKCLKSTFVKWDTKLNGKNDKDIHMTTKDVECSNHLKALFLASKITFLTVADQGF